MNRKEYLEEVRRLHPDKGGNNDEFLKFMKKFKDSKTDIFQQTDVFAKRNNIEHKNEEITIIYLNTDSGSSRREKIVFKHDNTIERTFLD